MSRLPVPTAAVLNRARACVIACGLVCLGALALMVTCGTATATADSLNWASGASIVAPANVNSSEPDIQINAVSCPSAGECTAVGSYTDQSGSPQGLLVTESGGSWQRGIEAQLPNSPNADPQANLSAVTCSSVGNCTAIGGYVDVHGWTEGVILTEAGGAWTTSNEVADPQGVSVPASPDVTLKAISCPTIGDCLVVGDYFNSRGHSQGLLEIERGGRWAGRSLEALPSNLPANAAPELPTSGAFLVVDLDAVSCAASGQCVAAGTYTTVNNGLQQALLVTEVETSGTPSTWFSGTEALLPTNLAATPDATVASISCPSLGACAAVGTYTANNETQQGLLLTETGGSWQTGTSPQLPSDAGTKPGASLLSVSCASVGNCDAVGFDYDAVGSTHQGLMLTDTGGTWGPGVEPAALPTDAGSSPLTALSSVSCSAPSSCAAAGTYSDGSFQGHALLLSQSADGSWSSPGIEPALPGAATEPAVNTDAVSCAPAGDCAAVADYTDAAGYALAAAVNGTTDAPATPTLSLTAPPSTVTPGTPLALSASLAGGAAETGTTTFGVFGPQSSPPVSCAFGATTIDSATVTGDGAYAAAASFTPTVAGDYWWYSSYGGDLGDSPTASVCGASMAETVVASPSVPPALTATTTATTTPSPTPSPTPTKTTPIPAPRPTARLTAVKVSGTAATATVVCDAPAGQACNGSLTLSVTESKSSAHLKSAHRVLVIGSRSCKLKGGARRQLSVALNGTGKSLLRSRQKLTARLRLTIDKQAITRTVTFTRVKR